MNRFNFKSGDSISINSNLPVLYHQSNASIQLCSSTNICLWWDSSCHYSMEVLLIFSSAYSFECEAVHWCQFSRFLRIFLYWFRRLLRYSWFFINFHQIKSFPSKFKIGSNLINHLLFFSFTLHTFLLMFNW